MELRLTVSDRTRQDLGNLLVLVAMDIVKQKDDAIAGRKFVEGIL